MVGIMSYGAYLPIWRMDRAEIANASGSRSMGGERTVAAWDEDSLTMGVEAGLDCLRGFDPKSIDALYFSTMSSPFKEKEASSIIANALDLRQDISVGDLKGSSRAGTLAVKVAFDAIGSGSAKRILVISADCRKARPRSEFEQINGDGAVAFLIGKDDTIADIKGFRSTSNAVPGGWQRDGDAFPKRFEPKLDKLYGLLSDVPGAVTKLMEDMNLKVNDISRFAFYAPDPRGYRDIAKVLRIDAKSQMEDPIFDKIGITGTPHNLLLLVSALQKANASEKIVCAGFSEGCDAFLIETTEKIEAVKGKHMGTDHIHSKKQIPSYGRFMDLQETREIGWPPKDTKASVVKYWRDQKWELPLYGMRCNGCGTLQFPISRCCMMCGEKDNYEETKLAQKGTIFTFTHDYLLGPGLVTGDGINPATRVALDMDDGCRLWLEMCDHELEEVEIGMKVETTFRLIHQKGGYPFYSWRVRPVRSEIQEVSK